MRSFIEATSFKIDKNPDWKLLEDLYNKNYLFFNGLKTEVIPKKIHQIWLGGEIPSKYNRLINLWKEKNPNWEFKLWNDNDVKKMKLINQKLFNASNNFGFKSDVLRYEILYEHGGLYVDTDFQCIKSFDDLTYLDFFTGGGYSTFPHAYNGLIASKPKHELMLNVINVLKEKENLDTKMGFDKILKFTGPDFFSNIFLSYIKKNTVDKIISFPRLFFYALPPGIRKEIRNENNDVLKKISSYTTDISYCLHLWHTSWQK
jgi:inositol phosphorylceramide mannosyltransferase catalytic subunit